MFFARFTRKKGGEVVRFSGFDRKTNHIPPFCERSEQHLSIYQYFYKKSTPNTEGVLFYLKNGLN
jgi:hypothetical protein